MGDAQTAEGGCEGRREEQSVDRVGCDLLPLWTMVSTKDNIKDILKIALAWMPACVRTRLDESRTDWM